MAAPNASRRLAASTTRAASTQSYLTIRLLADRRRRSDAYALYAYFRWLDDTIDERLQLRDKRLAFVERQRALLAAARAGTAQHLKPTREEDLLIGLAAAAVADANGDGLNAALDAMLDLMAFDADRRGRTITDDELASYTRTLAVAVSESLHHRIGHGSHAATGHTRYAAVEGAHIAHMLRDLMEDLELGFLNAPAALIDAEHPEGTDLHSAAMRAWVRERIALARFRFATGRLALEQAEHWRCRLAGHAYIARFEWVLDAIEADGYRLRRENFERIDRNQPLPDSPAVYLHAPTRIDPATAPAGRETLIAVVPTGHMTYDGDDPELIAKERDVWARETERSRTAVLERLAQIGLAGIEEHITTEATATALTWKAHHNLERGATHGLAHTLTQLAYLRPHNRHARYRNLYFAGASTHPGTGVPTALVSGRLAAERIVSDGLAVAARGGDDAVRVGALGHE